LKNFAEIIQAAKTKGPCKIVVAGGESKNILIALEDARKEGIAEITLVGNIKKIKELLQGLPLKISQFELEEAFTPEDCANLALQFILEGKAKVLMKGSVSTSTLMHAILAHKEKILLSKHISHIFVAEVPNYHKLLFVTDGGIIPHPTLEEKVSIINNAILFASRLGIPQPRIAIIGPSEEVSPKIPETVDAAILNTMAQHNQIKEAIIDGPLALDVAINKVAMVTKNISSPCNGEADILIVPSVTAGNMFAKGLLYFAQAKGGGILAGANFPIILLSRADSSEIKFNSIALAVATSY